MSLNASINAASSFSLILKEKHTCSECDCGMEKEERNIHINHFLHTVLQMQLYYVNYIDSYV